MDRFIRGNLFPPHDPAARGLGLVGVFVVLGGMNLEAPNMCFSQAAEKLANWVSTNPFEKIWLPSIWESFSHGLG